MWLQNAGWIWPDSVLSGIKALLSTKQEKVLFKDLPIQHVFLSFSLLTGYLGLEVVCPPKVLVQEAGSLMWQGGGVLTFGAQGRSFLIETPPSLGD